MPSTETVVLPNSSRPPGRAFRDVIRDAVRYWERGRVGYNIVLIGVASAWLVLTWPHFRPALTMTCALQGLVLAALANACYCAAYPVDLAIQRSSFQAAWRRWRWTLWCAGTLLACLLASYWIADEIYPAVA